MTHYVVPNETPLVYREMLKYRRIDRAAGICSAGEIGFFDLLPLVRDELVLIDQSYRSLSIAMTKYLILYEYGWQETQKIFKDQNKVRDLMTKFYAKLPKACQKNPLPSVTGREISSYWSNIPSALIKRAYEKRDKIVFMHGDMTDLVKKGPFDVFYCSNAIGYQNRFSNAPVDISKIASIVKPGGLIVGCDTYQVNNKWEELKSDAPGGMWRYKMYKVPVNAAVA